MEWNEQGGVAVKFQKETDYRTFVTMAVSLAPEVGQVLSGVIKLLWQDETPDALFTQMKQYVDRLVPALINKDKVQELDDFVKGLQNIMNKYQSITVLDEKKVHLLNLIDTVALIEPRFFEPPDPKEGGPRPERVLAHFVALGTTKMVALRELYLHGAQYYGSDADRQVHLRDLIVAVEQYTSAVAGIR